MPAIVHFSALLRGSRVLCAAGAAFALCVAGTALAEPDWTGRWVLNEARSAVVQPEQPESSNWLSGGRVRSNVSIGGIPLPGRGSKIPPQSTATAREPGVLRCKELTISQPSAEQVELIYSKVGSERLRRGKRGGARTDWTSSRLRTRYQTTERKVDQRYELQEDGSLLVTTRIKPDGAKRRTFKQVFEPATAETAGNATDR